MDISLNFKQLTESQKIRFYVDSNVPILDEEALFSDGTSNYRIPMEPEPYDTVKLRFRTGRENVDTVWAVINEERHLMKKTESDYYFDYYEVEYKLEDKRIDYYFRIRSGSQILYYNSKGVWKEVNPYYSFFIMPGYKTPDWAKGAIFYQIFVDRFYNGDSSNDVEDREYIYIGDGTVKVKDWDKYPAAMGIREFYGGDLKGVMDKLDYLQNLGVDVVYLNPIFVSPSNHKYDIQDYDYVDPHFGVIVEDGGEPLAEWDNNNSNASKYIKRVTAKANLEASNQLFIQLVEEIHRRGMRIILDGVFNHCGSFNKWLDREKIYKTEAGYASGAYISEDSPYHSYFRFHDDHWPENSSYDGWWGHDTLPKLNYEESKELFEDIMRIARKWVSPPFNVDGWRLDVAADLGYSQEFNHYFWKEFRRNVKEANPEAIILAEHYGDPSPWLQGEEWDTVMNYDAFMEPVTWFLTGVEKHSDDFRSDLLGASDSFFGAMQHHMSRFNTQSLLTAMNELSNHDHSRFLTRTNRKVGRIGTVGPEAASQNINKAIMRIAVLMQMTWPGAPTIYYGDEAGVCGWTDPDNRRTYPWGKEDQELIALHRDLIRIHKLHPALKYGSIIFLHGELQVISYGRFNAKEKMVIVVNSRSESVTLDIPVWKIGILDKECLERIILTGEEGYNIDKPYYFAEGGILHIEMPPQSSAIVKNIDNI